MRGASHDRPMMIAGPTPNNDIRPVTRGSPETITCVTCIESECLIICVDKPTTVETAAKFWATSSFDSSEFGENMPKMFLNSTDLIIISYLKGSTLFG